MEPSPPSHAPTTPLIDLTPTPSAAASKRHSPKRRQRSTPLPLWYCRNHSPASSSDSRRRVPCPVDPSHTVFEENLEAHVGKCPSGSRPTRSPHSRTTQGHQLRRGEAGGAAVTSATKRASVHKLSEEEFWGLVVKIRSAHTAAAVEMRESYIAPDACDKWMKGQVDRKVPYQEKHVVQQVSIVGNMETFGLLPRGGAEDATEEIAVKNPPAAVEFGAGRGYLTQMLADCYGIKNIFLVERRAYKLKADLSLRQNEGVKLERLRIDIEDLNLHGVQALNGGQYLAIGKHLCGPATDMTIMCCLHEQHNHTEEKGHDKHHLRGLALATCCHHLCQWKHYANKSFLSGLGIAEEEFHAMTWFSSWAVDGDHSSQDSLEAEDLSSEGRNRETEKPDPEIIGVERIIRSIPGVERSALGFMCKDIIDTGRLLWLRSKCLDADLVRYVPSDISPENHLLIAKCRS
ncbi:hypothetical protein ZWY2020_018978 [Hordeum vulgare]|nr:hypothetical protein ZWY2020_018978 [Hordeum vulgare]